MTITRLAPCGIGTTVLFAALLGIAAPASAANNAYLLQSNSFQPYVDTFNQKDNETVINDIPNASAWNWMSDNVPLFECPNKEMEQTYYFRWWSYRKHIVQTPEGSVVTEFLPPVPWAGAYNTINCPAAHQIYEGRWLRNTTYMDDYTRFYYGGSGNAGGVNKTYSTWLADAVYAHYQVTGDKSLPVSVLSNMVADYDAWGTTTSPWQTSRLLSNGLYWQVDGSDGMEYSAGGSGARPTINSYMYGNALAIAKTAELAGNNTLAQEYYGKAAALKTLVEQKLWNPEQQFFETRAYDGYKGNYGADPDVANDTLVNVREAVGFIPWYFNLPDGGQGYEAAWNQLTNPQGFNGPYGLTTAERRAAGYSVPSSGCMWNGSVWPYATSQTLTALANVLNNYSQDVVTKQDYYNALMTYTTSQRMTLPDGTVVPWIDESQNPDTGEWIVNDDDHGKDYNHSTYCDLIISGLVGLRPRADNILEVNPLIPDQTWDYFCLDDVAYHGKNLTIFWDATGEKYGHGAGFHVWANGVELARSPTLSDIQVTLHAPEPSAIALLIIGALSVGLARLRWMRGLISRWL